MRATKRRPVIYALVLAAAVTSAACGSDNPAGPHVAPAVRDRGGVTFGSGNFVANDSSSLGSADADRTVVGTDNTMAVDSSSTARGGVTFGSGN